MALKKKSRTCAATCEDWAVILVHRNNLWVCSLQNFDSTQKLTLPPVDERINYPTDTVGSKFDCLNFKDCSKCILHNRPSAERNCFIVFVHKFSEHLLFACPRDKKWSFSEVHVIFDDVVRCQGKVYGICGRGKLCEMNMHQGGIQIDRLQNVRTFSDHTSARKMQLVDSFGQLYMVRRNPVLLSGLEVFKLDFDVGWIQVRKLEGTVFVVTDNYSLSFSTKDLGVQENCIYVMNGKDKGSLYVYRLDDENSCTLLRNGDKTISVLHNGFIFMPIVRKACGCGDDLLEEKRDTSQVCGEETEENHLYVERREFKDICHISKRICTGEIGWSKLPTEVQSLIAERIAVGWGYINFRASSRSCRSLLSPIRWKLNPLGVPLKYPWLMFPYNDGYNFFDPMCNVTYRMNLSLLKGCKIYCSKDGWLLVCRPPSSMFFFEPFSKKRINIPDWQREYPIDGITVAGSPTSSEWTIFAFSHYSTIRIKGNHIRWGDSRWTESTIINDCNSLFVVNPAFWGQSFYCLSQDGNLRVFELPLKRHMRILDTPGLLETGFRNFLVPHAEKLVLVSLSHGGRSCHVYELHDPDKMWMEVQSLKEDVLFLSQMSCIAVQTGDQTINDTIQLSIIKNDIKQGNVFYSLKKRRYETTCDHYSVDLYNTKEMLQGMWIQPILIPELGN